MNAANQLPNTESGSESGNAMDEGQTEYGDMTATYSPDDNKLRMRSVHRLDKELYARFKEAGFIWAPKQELFVAPKWTPSREDLLLELCGEIGDEDTSLTGRAEERAERFEDYGANRADDAERARQGVAAIADNIPFGQPILVGHHSERHARKHAEQIENGMRKAVKMWETAAYWERRAKGALRHAKYKELPAVRARRIKTLEADSRKHERSKAEAELALKRWSRAGLTHEQAAHIANFCDLQLPRKEGDREDFHLLPSAYSALMNSHPSLYAIRTLEEVVACALASYPIRIAGATRWLDHYSNRIAYERAMLDEQGGTEADKNKPVKGGAVRCWVTRGAWLYIQKVNKITVSVLDNWGNGGENFPRNVPFDKLSGVMSADQVNQARADGLLTDLAGGTGFVLRAASADEVKQETTIDKSVPDDGDFAAMKEQLKSGVQVVVASQLFPTPPALAARMVDLAQIDGIGMRVLEPSAGLGSILQALPGVSPIPRAQGRQTAVNVVAIEINHTLSKALLASGLAADVRCANFLECDDLGTFDRILMNPPFEDANDIRHIRHAATLLNEGGRLVAICANGPRQNKQLRPWVEEMGGTWEVLEAGTFALSGTSVNTVLLSVCNET